MSEFVAYWDGGALSAYEQLSLLSFARRGHGVRLYSYSEPAGVPSEIHLHDAAEVLPRDERTETLLHNGAYSKVSDLLRLELLRDSRQTWVDVDVVLLREDVPTAPTLLAREDSIHVNTAVLRFETGSPILRRLLEETRGLSAETLLATAHGFPGPLLLTSVIQELELGHLALPPEALYPVASRDLWRLFDPRETDWCWRTLKDASTLHLWNEFIRRADLKGKRPPRGSWLDRSMREYGVKQPWRVADARWIRGPWRQQLPEPPPVAARPTLRSVARKAARWARSGLRRLRAVGTRTGPEA